MDDNSLLILHVYLENEFLILRDYYLPKKAFMVAPW